jgi:hypothetical protein
MLLISALGGTAVLADGSAVSATPTIPSGVAIALGGLFSASTLVAIVTLVRDVLIERGKRKDAKESAAVVAQKDVREGESIREGEYRNLAEQARKSAETAVQVIKASLDATQGVVTQLQAVIESQNRTIATLTAAQGESSELLAAAREDRDRTQHALSVAEAKGRHEQRERIRLEAELATKEQDLALLDDLLYASVIAHPHRPTTGPIPTSKEHA